MFISDQYDVYPNNEFSQEFSDAEYDAWYYSIIDSSTHFQMYCCI